MKISTKHTILRVARALFARRGAENITMDDVAKASGLGRRTLYTYFRTREELYHEVVKHEIDVILNQLHRVVSLKLSADKKIGRFMLTHMKTIEQLLRRHKLLRTDFINRTHRIETIRQDVDLYEKQCILSILNEGATSGVFHVEDPENTAFLALTTLKGMERQFILENFGEPCQQKLDLWQKILIRGIRTPA